MRGALGQGAFAPARFFGDQFDYAAHAFGVDAGAVLGRRRCAGVGGEQVQAELHRILAGGVRQFVDEALNDERERVAAGRAQRAGADASGCTEVCSA